MEKYFSINSGGYSIRCKLYYSDLKKVKRVLVCVHGFGGHKDNRAVARIADRALTKYHDIALVSFDLPCHGDDVHKKLEISTCFDYIREVTCWVADKFPGAVLYCHAISFGAYLTLRYVHDIDNPFEKMVLRSAAVNMYDSLLYRIAGEAELEKISAGKDTSIGFDRKVTVTPAFLENLKNNDIQQLDFIDFADDIVMLHGTADEIIPIEAVRVFADNNVIELREIDGADHRFRDVNKMNTVVEMLLDFIK